MNRIRLHVWFFVQANLSLLVIQDRFLRVLTNKSPPFQGIFYKVKTLFTKLQVLEDGNWSQVIDLFFNHEPQNCFTSVKFWDEGDVLMVSYQTKWEPNFQDSMKIAHEYEVSFIHDCFEFGCGIYQRCIYVTLNPFIFLR